MRKLLFLTLAGIMSIAVLGVGYALWSDQLTIEGTVTTGTVDIQLSGPYFNDQGDGGQGNTNWTVTDEESEDPGGDTGTCTGVDAGGAPDGSLPCGTGLPGDDLDAFDEDKDVAECVATPDFVNDALSVVITVAYPSFDCWVAFDITYKGTIPAHLSVSDSIGGGFAEIDPSALTYNCASTDGLSDGSIPVESNITDPEGWLTANNQFHENDSLFCVLNIHFANDTPGFTSGWDSPMQYGWGFAVDAKQFNES